MKKVLLLMMLLAFSYDSIYAGRYDYDSGYEDAWEGTKRSGKSQEYYDGHEQGLDDAFMDDMGYYDAKSGKNAKYPKDPDYMDGYKDGSKKR